MQALAVPIAFYEDTILMVHGATGPMVVMKPIVDNLGLDWPTQYVKLVEKFKLVVGEVPVIGPDGKTYNMICLPLRKLPAWLYSINPNKVNLALRQKIIRYQEECDDVLWTYWDNQQPNYYRIQLVAAREPQREIEECEVPSKIKLSILLKLQHQKQKLMDEIDDCTHPAIRAGLYIDLRRISDTLGVDVPELDSFALPRMQRLPPLALD